MKDTKKITDKSKDNRNKDYKNGNQKRRGKRAQLNIRLLQTEKRKLERKAQKSGLNLSEYTRARLFGGDKKQQNPEMISQCVILCQDILNIVEEKYSSEDNSMLEEKVEKLWKMLS